MQLSLLLATSVALAGAKQDVRDVFQTYVEREAAFDAALFELYTPDAEIEMVRRGVSNTIRVADVAPDAERMMTSARAANERNTYDKVTFKRNGSSDWVVTAVRESLGRCYTDDRWQMRLTKTTAGWRVHHVEMHTPGISLCAPSPDLAAAMDAVVSPMQAMLPRDAGPLRLERVDVEGSSILYRLRMREPTDDMDPNQLRAGLAQTAFQAGCSAAHADILRHGGNLLYAFVGPDDGTLGDFLLTAPICEAAAAKP